MGNVLADQQGWLAGSQPPYSDAVVLHTFDKLRRAVNSGEADFFMWEHFTSKRYYDSGEIRRVGEIYTPWSSWKIVASTRLAPRDARLEELFTKLDQGIKHFNENKDEAATYIATNLDYSEEDAREWMKTVKFPTHTKGVSVATIESCVDSLQKAGVLYAGKGMGPPAMIAHPR